MPGLAFSLQPKKGIGNYLATINQGSFKGHILNMIGKSMPRLAFLTT